MSFKTILTLLVIAAIVWAFVTPAPVDVLNERIQETQQKLKSLEERKIRLWGTDAQKQAWYAANPEFKQEVK